MEFFKNNKLLVLLQINLPDKKVLTQFNYYKGYNRTTQVWTQRYSYTACDISPENFINKVVDDSWKTVKLTDGFTNASNQVNNKGFSLYNLADLEVECVEDSIIQGLHLIRAKPDTIGYEYKCLKSNLGKITTYSTNWSGTESLWSLYGHNIFCPKNSALKRFKVLKADGQQIKFEYDCMKSIANNCAEFQTIKTEKDAKSMENIWLERQFINLSGKRYLTQFKLNIDVKLNTYNYEYKLCDSYPQKDPIASQTGTNSAGGTNNDDGSTSDVKPAQDGIIGIDGKCLNLNADTLTPYISVPFKPFWSVLKSVISAILGDGLKACFGDFSGKRMQEEAPFCDNIPVDEGDRFGVVSYNAEDITCGATPQKTTATTCIAFDREGTFALSMNLGTASCALSLMGASQSGGIVPLVASLSEVVKEISFGFAQQNKFILDVNLAFRDGNNVIMETRRVKGQVFLSMTLELPSDYLKIGKHDLSEILTFEVSSQIVMDLGLAEALNSSTIKDLKNGSTKSNAALLLKNLIKIGKDIAYKQTGRLVIKLQDLTFGLLNDFVFNFIDATMLLTNGNGNSKLKAGFYMNICSNVSQDFVNNINSVIANFSEILNKLGLNIDLSIPNFGACLGIAFDIEYFSLRATFNDNSFQCLFKYSDQNISCNFGDKFFSALSDGIKFVFKEAKEFFDNTGKVISEMATETWNKSTQELSKQMHEMENKFKDAQGQLLNVGSNAANAITNEANKAYDEAQRKADEIRNNARKTAEEAARVAEKTFQDALDLADKAQRQLKDSAEAGIKQAKDLANQAQRDLEKAADWIKDQANNAKRELEKIGNKIKDALCFWC